MENNTETKQQFAGMMYGIAGNFGGNINKHDLKLRFKLLQDYSIEDVEKAGIWLLLNREKTFPAVPTVKEFLDTLQATLNPQLSPTAQAEAQCDIVLKYFARDGSACDHIFKHPVTRYLMTHRWGFYKIGAMRSKDLKWFRRDFVEAWKDLNVTSESLQLAINSDQAPEVVGMIATNNLNKLLTEKPIGHQKNE